MTYTAFLRAILPTHVYTKAGTYTVSLRVMDNRNMYSAKVTKAITVGSTGVHPIMGMVLPKKVNIKQWSLDGRVRQNLKRSQAGLYGSSVTIQRTITEDKGKTGTNKKGILNLK